MIVDWDDAYANAAHIPGGEAYPARWEARAAAFRAAAGERLRSGLPYGPHPRQRFDLFLPEGTPRGLVVFVHGGYWRAFDRGTWSHLAGAPRSGEIIVSGAERGKSRVIVGNDAKAGALFERLMPVGYWNILKRSMA